MSKEGSANGWLTDDSDEIDLVSLRDRIKTSTRAGNQVNQTQDKDDRKNLSSSQPREAKRTAPLPIIDLDDDYDEERHLSSSLLIHRASDDSHDDNFDEYGLDEIEKNEPVSKPINRMTENDEIEKKKDTGTEGHPTKRPRTADGPRTSMPLVVAPKLDESITLLQSVDDNLDLSGDVGAVGRAKINNGRLYLDIKGMLYNTGVSPTNTMCIVSIGDDEAKITAVTDEVITLRTEENLFDSNEVVVHGDINDLEDNATDNNIVNDDGNMDDESLDTTGITKSGTTSKKSKTTKNQGKKKSKESSGKSSRVQTKLKF